MAITTNETKTAVHLLPATASIRQLPRIDLDSLPLLPSAQPIPADQPALPLRPRSPRATGTMPGSDSESADQARRLAGSLASALVEILAGRRGPQQLSGWASPKVQELVTQLSRSQRCSGLRLRSIRVQQINDLVIEVAAHLTQTGRSRAAALRITRDDGRWQATELVIVLDHQGQPESSL